jgi:general secretion pathway protein K
MVTLLRENKGIALILTILIVGLIVTLTLQFNKSMRSNLYAAANLSDGIKLGCIARSGFNGACALLHEDRSSGNVDTLHELWAQSGVLSESAAILFDEGRVSVEIMDLSGRIQINQLVDEKGQYNDTQKGLLLRFLSSPEFGLDPEEAENFLEELQFVRGITEELLHGSSEKPGILPYLSPYGDGRININTADPLVIRALSDQIDQDLVDAIIAYRVDEDNDLSNITWYKKVSGMSDVSIPEGLLTTLSTYFEIISQGFKEAMSKRIRGVVEREEETVKILSWKVE